MKFEYTFPENNCMHWEMDNCFAFEGMKMIGVKQGYECLKLVLSIQDMKI